MRLAMRSMSGVISSAPRSHLSGLTVRATAYAILGVLWMLPFWTHFRACPMGLHDWAYPCLDQQRSAYLPSLVAPWWDTDLGVAHALPQITLPWLLLGALVWLSPAVGLRLFILAAFAGAAIAADVAAEKLFGVSRSWARFAAGALYAGSPFLATKLASGQLGFIACAALVPAALVALDAVAKGGGLRAWAACAICAASAFAQVQVGIVLLALLAVAGWGRVRARDWLGIWAIAALTWMPAAYITLVAYRDGALTTEAQLSVWLADKSVPWVHALDGTSYFAHYFTRAAPVASYMWWLLAVVGTCVAIARSESRRLGACALVLGVLATGTTGPVGPAISWLLARAPGFQIFREFYDLLFLAPLVVAAGVAASVDSLRARSGTTGVAWSAIAAAAASAMLVVALWPATTGAAARLIPFVDGLPGAPRIAGDDRIMWLPATPPIGSHDSIGGADPYQLAIDGHPTAGAFHPTGVLAYTLALADRGSVVSSAMLERLDVAAAIMRPGLFSQRVATSASVHDAPVAPDRAPAAPPDASIIAIAFGRPTCEPALRSALMSDLVAYSSCPPPWSVVPREDAETSTDDPATAWIGGERWALLDPNLAEPRWPVLFTTSKLSYDWTQPADGVTWIYARSGALLDGRRIAPSSRWRALPTHAGRHSLRDDGASLVAISASVPKPAITRAQVPALESRLDASVSDRLLGRFEATLPAHHVAYVVLRTGWSPDWRATIDGRDLGPPRVADGYAAGWTLEPSIRESTISIVFAPSAQYVAMLAIAWMTLACLIVLFAKNGLPFIGISR